MKEWRMPRNISSGAHSRDPLADRPPQYCELWLIRIAAGIAFVVSLVLAELILSGAFAADLQCPPWAFPP
jgi:hypothetical protein